MNSKELQNIIKGAFSDYMETDGRAIIREEMKTVVIAMLTQQQKMQKKLTESKSKPTVKKSAVKPTQKHRVVKKKPIVKE